MTRQHKNLPFNSVSDDISGLPATVMNFSSGFPSYDSFRNLLLKGFLSPLENVSQGNGRPATIL